MNAFGVSRLWPASQPLATSTAPRSSARNPPTAADPISTERRLTGRPAHIRVFLCRRVTLASLHRGAVPGAPAASALENGNRRREPKAPASYCLVAPTRLLRRHPGQLRFG